MCYPDLNMKNERLARLLLRVGLALVFLYAAVASTLDPSSWVGFLPAFLRNLIPQALLLSLFSLYQVGLGLWLLSGKKIYAAGILASVTLAAIIVSNITLLDVVFRDVAIFFAALALTALHRDRS